MRTEPMRYLQWAKDRFDERPPRLNLGSSGMQPPSMEEAGIDPARLRLVGNNTFGHPEVRRKIGQLHGVGPERVVLAAGTSQANFLVHAALVRPGDTVLCEWPCYEPLWRSLEMAGARIEWVQRDPARGYAPDLPRIAEGFARGARLLVLSDLHNPSATLLERDVVREIARLARRHDAWVQVDEVYLSGVFERAVESAVRLGERVVVTSSLTKSYGLGHLKCGWAIAPPEIVARMHVVADYVSAGSPFLAEEAMSQVLDHLPALRDRAAQRRAENWPLVRAFAEIQRLELAPAAGGFIAWLKLPEGLDSDRFVDHLFERTGTLVVPGAFFGAPDHVRIGFGGPATLVAEGLECVGMALEHFT